MRHWIRKYITHLVIALGTLAPAAVPLLVVACKGPTRTGSSTQAPPASKQKTFDLGWSRPVLFSCGASATLTGRIVCAGGDKASNR